MVRGHVTGVRFLRRPCDVSSYASRRARGVCDDGRRLDVGSAVERVGGDRCVAYLRCLRLSTADCGGFSASCGYDAPTDFRPTKAAVAGSSSSHNALARNQRTTAINTSACRVAGVAPPRSRDVAGCGVSRSRAGARRWQTAAFRRIGTGRASTGHTEWGNPAPAGQVSP